MADMQQKEIIFGFLEVTLGLATAATLSAASFETDEWFLTFACLFGCSGGLVPLLVRWNVRYFSGGTLPKAAEWMIMIWVIVLYLVGGIMIIVVRQENLARDIHYMPAVFAIIVAVISLVDFILGCLGK